MLLEETQIYTYLDSAVKVIGFNDKVKETKYKRIYQAYKINCSKLKNAKHSIFTNHCDELDMYGHTMSLMLALQKNPLLENEGDNCILAMYTALKMYEEPFDVYTTDLGYCYEPRTKVDYDSYFFTHVDDHQRLFSAFNELMHTDSKSFKDLMDDYTAIDFLDDLYCRAAKIQKPDIEKVKSKFDDK